MLTFSGVIAPHVEVLHSTGGSSVLCPWLSRIFLSCRSAGFLCIYVLEVSVFFQLLGFIAIILFLFFRSCYSPDRPANNYGFRYSPDENYLVSSLACKLACSFSVC